MTTTYILSASDILAIYNAGISRGNEEASSYEWGGRTSTSKFDNLEDVMRWEAGSNGGILSDTGDAYWAAFLDEIKDAT